MGVFNESDELAYVDFAIRELRRQHARLEKKLARTKAEIAVIEAARALHKSVINWAEVHAPKRDTKGRKFQFPEGKDPGPIQ